MQGSKKINEKNVENHQGITLVSELRIYIHTGFKYKLNILNDKLYSSNLYCMSK